MTQIFNKRPGRKIDLHQGRNPYTETHTNFITIWAEKHGVVLSKEAYLELKAALDEPPAR